MVSVSLDLRRQHCQNSHETVRAMVTRVAAPVGQVADRVVVPVVRVAVKVVGARAGAAQASAKGAEHFVLRVRLVPAPRVVPLAGVRVVRPRVSDPSRHNLDPRKPIWRHPPLRQPTAARANVG